MGAPGSGIEAAEQTSTEALLSAFKTISPSERRKHASVLNYWLSIRGDKEFPPLHDLDPLELSDAGPSSILLELISGGHDAELRHLGDALKGEGMVDRIIDAPQPSLLASIAKKLPLVAISRDFLAYEDEYAGENGETRCWVTLLPLSAGGAWVDYVYALVSLDSDGAKTAKKTPDPKKAKDAEPDMVAEAPVVQEPEPEAVPEAVEEAVVDEADANEFEQVTDEQPAEHVDQATAEVPVADVVAEAPAEGPVADLEPIPEFLQAAPDADDSSAKRPGFSKLFDNLVGLTGFYGHGYKVDGNEAEGGYEESQPPLADEPVGEPATGEERAADVPGAEVLVEAALEESEPSAAEEAVADDSGPDAAEEAGADQDMAEQPVAEEPPVDEREGPQAVTEFADEPKAFIELAHASAPALEGTLQSKLTDVRAKADEAQQAKLRATAALHEGLSAAYDFALDAEEAPEEYLKLVEAQGLKIQLRSPMKPVVKLAFADTCDDSTIKQLEAVLAWALDNELPRGSLLERIEAAGGIAPLAAEAKAA